MAVLSVLRSREFWIGTATLGLTCCIVSWLRQPKNLPPGPISLPIIGGSYRLSWSGQDEAKRDFIKLGKQYGDVFSMYCGNRLVVVINDFEIIKEIFGRSEDCADRIIEFGFGQMWQIKDVVMNCPYTPHQVTEKKFALQAMRTHGLGRIEELVAVEAEIISKVFQENKDAPVAVMMLIQKALTNTSFSIVSSTRYEEDDQERDTILGLVSTLFEQLFTIMLPTYYFPDLLVKLLYRGMLNKLGSTTQQYEDIITQKIQEHQKSFDPSQPRDIIDFYLQAGKLEQYGSMRNLAHSITILQLDGILTIAMVFNSVMLCVAAYPEVQAHIQKEIDDAVGRDQLPTLADRPKMPYTLATIWEVLRMSFPVTSFQHFALKDITIKGYHVPKSAEVIANFYATQINPEVWPEPEKFKPERFITADGELTGTSNLFPFGLGRRKCVGEQISMAQLFLFLTNMLQKFRFSVAEGKANELKEQLKLQDWLDPTGSFQIIPHER